MNAAHAHLIFIHFPVAGSFLALVMAGLAWKFQNAVFRRTVLAFVIGISLLSIPAYVSGDGAEEIAERLSGIDEAAVERHEEAAEAGFISLMISGGIAVLMLVAALLRNFSCRWTFALLAVSLAVSCLLIGRAANFGGLIRHPEIEMTSVE